MRLHIVVLSPSGAPAYTAYGSSVAEAVRVAEGQVRSRLEKP